VTVEHGTTKFRTLFISDVHLGARGCQADRLLDFLRYHDAENWPLLREALKRMGRADLIGPGKHQLIPSWQPAGTGLGGGEGARSGRKHGGQTFLTQQTTQTRRPGLKPGWKSRA